MEFCNFCRKIGLYSSLQVEITGRQIERVEKNKFFHRTTNCHKRYNNIDKMIINGYNTTEPAGIRDEITVCYQKLYTETEVWRPQFNPRFQCMVNEEGQCCTARPI